ncbi:putative N-acetyltransferase YedL [Terrihabitans soli]|uniref:Putative N-acetyltransferase YedL n=1 Tax=Terrihabitans soli TaxID=708113 RepID=A0A6S6QP44_9HYPH|nr:GNAT family N-acetyltransferase [Terrihabitans soli]BCJ92324.1 putative N-acetyltransferase YedL [Terrihabitans soli]
MAGLSIKTDDLSGDQIRALLAFHVSGMLEQSPPGTCYALDLSELQVPEITVWSVWDGDDLAGCGALKEIEPGWGEVKSMRTATAHLRKGVAAALLDHIIATAKSRGYTRLSLETGTSADYDPATALYKKRGFTNGGIFGDYTPSPHNQFLHLDL